MNYPFAKLLLAAALLMVMVGCASIGPPTAPSLELPKPPTDLKATRKGDRVTLTWSIPKRTMDRQSVRYLGRTQVCRNAGTEEVANRATHDQSPPERESSGDYSSVAVRPLKECGTVVGSVAAPSDFLNASKNGKRLTTNYVDILTSETEDANPTGFATYSVSVMNEAGRSAGLSNLARVPLVPTVQPFADYAARPQAQGVLITWQCPPASGRRTGVNYLFRVYRRPESSATETKVAEIDATECVSGPGGLLKMSGQNAASSGAEPGKVVTSFLDSSIEWEKTYFYRGTVVSVVEAAGRLVEVEGEDSPEVKVFAHDVFPPAVPTGLQAVYSGPGQQAFIDLIWAPVADMDLAGYNVYRREEGGPVKVNSELVKTPAYRDSAIDAGRTYFYSVTAVDRQGNQSAKSEETGERTP